MKTTIYHHQAAREVDWRLMQGEELVVVALTLVEAYSVPTCLPPPNRLLPIDALTLLEANFMSGSAEIAALSADEYIHSSKNTPSRRTAGRTVFDAVIFGCAQAAGVATILTFNERHFRSLS